jgi:hypothetical protein
MNDQMFLTRSVLLAGDPGALQRFALRLRVAPEHLFVGSKPAGYDFMARRQNHIEGCEIEGDFRYMFDIFLWDSDLALFEQDMVALSREQMVIGLDDDSEQAPFGAVFYHNGMRVSGEITDDEVTGETWIHKPADIRKAAHSLSKS